MWFATFSPDDGKLDPAAAVAGKHRYQRPGKDLREWLKKVGLPYHSPHKFRHGHAVYALKMAKDISDLKAVSQNLMHSNISITDGVYGVLSARDLKEQIEALGQKIISSGTSDIEELKEMTKALMEKLGVDLPVKD